MAHINSRAESFISLCIEFEKQLGSGADWTLMLNRVRTSYENLSQDEKLSIFALLEGIDDFKSGKHHLCGLPEHVIVGRYEAMANDSEKAEYDLAIQSFNELKIADPAPYARLQKLKGTTLFLDIAELDGTLPPHPAPPGPV